MNGWIQRSKIDEGVWLWEWILGKAAYFIALRWESQISLPSCSSLHVQMRIRNAAMSRKMLTSAGTVSTHLYAM